MEKSCIIIKRSDPVRMDSHTGVFRWCQSMRSKLGIMSTELWILEQKHHDATIDTWISNMGIK